MNLKYRRGLGGILIAALIMIVLASCGQKGDLYLPDKQQSTLTKSHIVT